MNKSVQVIIAMPFLLRISLSLLILSISLSLSAQQPQWQYTNIIDETNESGSYPDMIMAPNGTMHVTYWHQVEDRLIYLTRSIGDTLWTREYVDISIPNGFKSSLALDSQNKPHVAYFENDQGLLQLRYAVRTAPGTWSIESLPDHPTRNWGEYGPSSPNNRKERIVPSIDLLINSNDEPHIAFFDAWMDSDAFPVCTQASKYGFRLHQAWREQGVWKVRSFGKIDNITNACGGSPTPLGDRYGEYCTLKETHDGKMAISTMSRFNNHFLLFETTDNDSTWKKTRLDSLERIVKPDPFGWWQWSFKWFTVEGIDFLQSPDSQMHFSYTTSLFYGENFCCVDPLNQLVYARRDTSDSLIYRRLLKGKNYNFTRMAHLGNDQLFITYANVTDGKISMAMSQDSGDTWVHEDIFPTVGITYSPINVFSNVLHVLIYDSFNDRLVLATREISDSLWAYEEVTLSQNFGQTLGASIATEGGDTTLHLVYNESVTRKLWYTTGSANNNWAWTHENLDPQTLGFKAASVKTGPGGIPLVLYGGGSNYGLTFAWKENNSWQYEHIDSLANVGYTSLAMNPADSTLHILWHDGSSQCLHYGTRHWSDSTWILDIVDCGMAPVGEFPSMVLDANGDPRISYYSEFELDLKYAVKNQGTRAWATETVFSHPSSPVGKFSSITMGLDGRPKIAFIEEQNTAIRLAERNPAGQWDISLVDSSAAFNLGRPTVLQLDSYGNPWIAYSDNTNFDEVTLMKRDSVWSEKYVANNGRISNSFAFMILGEDLYIVGKKTEPGNPGLAFLHAPRATLVGTNDIMEQEGSSLSTYPNPFQESTTLTIQLDQAQNVSLKVYDLYGKMVGTLLDNKKLSRGAHLLEFKPVDLGAGIYFCELQTPTRRIVRKVVLLN